MKRINYLAMAFAIIMTCCSITGCSQSPSSSQQESSSAPESILSSTSVPAPQISSEPLPASNSESWPGALAKYDSLEDIPGVGYSLMENGEIEINGELRYAPPGPSRFTPPVFADSQHLFVNAVFSEEDGGSNQWYYISWEEQELTTIEGSGDKMFTDIDGTFLVCDSGEKYDTSTMQWVTE